MECIFCIRVIYSLDTPSFYIVSIAEMKAKYGWSANALDGKLPKEVQDCRRNIWLEAPQEHVFGKYQAEYVLASDENITDKMGDIVGSPLVESP